MVFIDLLSSPEGLVLQFDQVVMLKTPDVSKTILRELKKTPARSEPTQEIPCLVTRRKEQNQL